LLIDLAKLVVVSRRDGSRFDPFAFCIFFNTGAAKTLAALRRTGAVEKAWLPARKPFFLLSLSPMLPSK
jgi:hypothetical protein